MSQLLSVDWKSPKLCAELKKRNIIPKNSDCKPPASYSIAQLRKKATDSGYQFVSGYEQEFAERQAAEFNSVINFDQIVARLNSVISPSPVAVVQPKPVVAVVSTPALSSVILVSENKPKARINPQYAAFQKQKAEKLARQAVLDARLAKQRMTNEQRIQFDEAARQNLLIEQAALEKQREELRAQQQLQAAALAKQRAIDQQVAQQVAADAKLARDIAAAEQLAIRNEQLRLQAQQKAEQLAKEVAAAEQLAIKNEQLRLQAQQKAEQQAAQLAKQKNEQLAKEIAAAEQLAIKNGKLDLEAQLKAEQLRTQLEKQKAEQLAAQVAKQKADQLAAQQLAKQKADQLAAQQLAKQKADQLAAQQLAKQKAEQLAAQQLAKQKAEQLAVKQKADELAAKQKADQVAAQQAAKQAAAQLAKQKKDEEKAAKLKIKQDKAAALAQKKADRLAAQKSAEAAVVAKATADTPKVAQAEIIQQGPNTATQIFTNIIATNTKNLAARTQNIQNNQPITVIPPGFFSAQPKAGDCGPLINPGNKSGTDCFADALLVALFTKSSPKITNQFLNVPPQNLNFQKNSTLAAKTSLVTALQDFNALLHGQTVDQTKAVQACTDIRRIVASAVGFFAKGAKGVNDPIDLWMALQEIFNPKVMTILRPEKNKTFEDITYNPGNIVADSVKKSPDSPQIVDAEFIVFTPIRIMPYKQPTWEVRVYDFPPTLTLENKKVFKLQSFIAYAGGKSLADKTPISAAGHYVTYVKCGDAWLKFDDLRPGVPQTLATAPTEELAKESVMVIYA